LRPVFYIIIGFEKDAGGGEKARTLGKESKDTIFQAINNEICKQNCFNRAKK